MKPFRERSPILTGLISVGVLLAITAFAFSINRFPFLTHVYLIKADFADAAGLTPENEVRVAGLKVGKVRGVELARDRVRVTMEIKDNVKLGKASTAEIKLKTILGSKFVSITPTGGAPYLKAGDRIPLERSVIPFEFYQVTNQTVDTIGRIDASALNDSLRELAKLTEDPTGNFGRAFDGLSKATASISERDADLESLLRSSDTLLAALAARSDELGRILDAGSNILGALSARRQALKDFVVGTDRVSTNLSDLLRSTRTNLDPALRDLHTTLQVVAGRQGELGDTLKVLGPDAESFGRIFLDGTWGNIFTETVSGVPVPPSLPIGPP